MPVDHRAPPLPGPPPLLYTTKLPSLCMYAYAPEWPEVPDDQMALPSLLRYITRLPSSWTTSRVYFACVHQPARSLVPEPMVFDRA